LGDARELPFPDASADAGLLLGPLYPLTEADARVRALAEAARVLRPGGRVIVAAIPRFASTLDGLVRGFVAEPEFAEIVERDVASGVHLNPARRQGWFTTAYFHRPDELRDELEGAAFAVDAVVAVEGPGWLVDDSWLEDDLRRGATVRAVLR